MNTDYLTGIRLLTAASTTIDSPVVSNEQSKKFLVKAAQKNDFGRLQELLKQGADEGLADALREAAFSGHIASIKVFLDGGIVEKIDHSSLRHLINYGSSRRARELFAHDPRTQGFFTKEKLAALQKTMSTPMVATKEQPKLYESLLRSTNSTRTATNTHGSDIHSTGNGPRGMNAPHKITAPQALSLFNLPSELVINIIERLNNPSDSANLRMTCHELSDMAFSQHLENFINKSALALLEKIKYPITVIKEQKKIESTYRSAWTYLLQLTHNRTALKAKERAQASELMKVLIVLRPYIINVEEYVTKLFPDSFPTKLFSLLANEVHLDRCIQLILRHFSISKKTPEVAPFIIFQCPPLKNLTGPYNILYDIQKGKYSSLLFYIVENFHLFDRDEDSIQRDALESLLTLLFEHGCDLEQTDSKGQTVLISAVSLAAHFEDSKVNYNKQAFYKIISLLLEKGANCNARDREGFTPLMIACKSGQEEVVKLLINQPGIEINAVKFEIDDSYTALDYAIPHNVSIIQTLLRQQRTNLDIGPNAFFKELYYAIEVEDVDTVQHKLLTSIMTTEMLVSIFHYATLKGNSAIINTVLQRLDPQAFQPRDQVSKLVGKLDQQKIIEKRDEISLGNTQFKGKEKI
jgi:hypothetical protein